VSWSLSTLLVDPEDLAVFVLRLGRGSAGVNHAT